MTLLGARRLDAAEAKRCCVITVRDLRIATRQRDRGDVGYRGQRYAFDDAFVDVRDEADAFPQAASSKPGSSRTLIQSTGAGAFEYFARWPAAKDRPSYPVGDRVAAALDLAFGLEQWRGAVSAQTVCAARRQELRQEAGGSSRARARRLWHEPEGE